jgi:Rrf2 family protein
MLKLTKKADYGLIALKHLATAGAGRGAAVSAKEIADAYRIPVPLLAKVLQKMSKAGFLQSEHGTNGGYRLKRDPHTLSALEVIRAIDGPIILTHCFTGSDECGQHDRCTVREPLRKVHEGILRLLASITISDMAQEDFDVVAPQAAVVDPSPARLFSEGRPIPVFNA